MLTAYVRELAQHITLTSELQTLLENTLTVRSIPKGEHLLKAGEVSRAFYYNLQGLVRMYYLVEGIEKTTYFYPEGHYISAYDSFVRQTPAAYYFQACEPTQVVEINQEAAFTLLQQAPEMEALARRAMEDELISHQAMVAALLTQSPEQRYQQLQAHQPQLIQRVPQVILASYLGIAPESLSRIKKRLIRKS